MNFPGTLAMNLSGTVNFAPSGGLSGTGNLTIMGPGTVNLTGTNTISGTVSVTGGTLGLVVGSVGAGATVSVSDPGALSLSGLTPTSTPLFVSSLSLGSTSGAVLNLTFNGFSTTAPINVTSSNGLILTGIITVNIVNPAALMVGEVPLITYSGTALSSGLIVGTLPNPRGYDHSGDWAAPPTEERISALCPSFVVRIQSRTGWLLSLSASRLAPCWRLFSHEGQAMPAIVGAPGVRLANEFIPEPIRESMTIDDPEEIRIMRAVRSLADDKRRALLMLLKINRD